MLSAYGRSSIDGKGLPLTGSVHYGQEYNNAFFDGEQMVFGDGDGEIFLDFTVAVDVIAHELAHGLTQYTANLRYEGQSGALNESVSDVFGALVKQYSLGQSAEQADWLIGAGLLAPGVSGKALRSMKAPGTAYDDDVLGKDPQPGSMEDYIETEEDNGGVHLNSGIPNRAFYLTATALGGNSWERAGQIWFDVLTGGELTANADFAQFARLTVARRATASARRTSGRRSSRRGPRWASPPGPDRTDAGGGYRARSDAGRPSGPEARRAGRPSPVRRGRVIRARSDAGRPSARARPGGPSASARPACRPPTGQPPRWAGGTTGPPTGRG